MNGVWLLTTQQAGNEAVHTAFSSLPVLIAAHPELAPHRRQMYTRKVFTQFLIGGTYDKPTMYTVERIKFMRPGDV